MAVLLEAPSSTRAVFLDDEIAVLVVLQVAVLVSLAPLVTSARMHGLGAAGAVGLRVWLLVPRVAWRRHARVLCGHALRVQGPGTEHRLMGHW